MGIKENSAELYSISEFSTFCNCVIVKFKDHCSTLCMTEFFLWKQEYHPSLTDISHVTSAFLLKADEYDAEPEAEDVIQLFTTLSAVDSGNPTTV